MKATSITSALLLAFTFSQGFCHADPLGPPGTEALYELAGELVDRPEFEMENRLSVVTATIRLGPVVENLGEPPRQWYGLEFARLNGERYQMWILLDGWPTAEHAPAVSQYLWREPGWPDALNFVHEVTGVVQLPRLCLWTYGWPQQPGLGGGSNRAPVTGLPYPYQIHYTSLVREAFNRNPNRDMDALLHAAKVAVVIPYGYTFSPYHMHRIDWLHLERENQYGVTYREVLTNAALEVERLLRAGIDFDIAVDDPLFHKTGYDRLIYAQADGTVRVEREGETEAQYPNARPVDRPDLGPAPRLTLEVVEPEEEESGKLRIRAITEIGTGEWAGERPEPLISWEIYGPDNKVRPSIFPEYGTERTLELDDSVEYTLQHPVPEHLRERGRKAVSVEGSYTVRAATADVFGRPAVAYKTIFVQAE